MRATPPKPSPTVAESGFLDRILAGVGDIRAFAALASRTRRQHDPILRLAALALWTGDDADRLHERLRLSNAEGQRLLQDRPDAGAPARPLRPGRPQRCSANGATGTATPSSATRWRSPPRAAGNGRGRAISPKRRRFWRRPAPVCPFGGAAVLARGIAPGPIVGAIVARAEALWIEAGFPEDAAIRADMLERAAAAILAK